MHHSLRCTQTIELGGCRSLLTQEGICLTLEPAFRFLEVAYPYVARRLLTDEDPILRERLFEVRWAALENRGAPSVLRLDCSPASGRRWSSAVQTTLTQDRLTSSVAMTKLCPCLNAQGFRALTVCSQVLFHDGKFQWRRLRNLIALAKDGTGGLDLSDTVSDGMC